MRQPFPTISALTIVLLIIPGTLAAAERSVVPVGRVTAAFGSALMQGPGGQRIGELHTLVNNGDRICTDGGGLTVLLASRVVLKLDQHTAVTIHESSDQLNLILEHGTLQLFVGARPLSSGPVAVHDPQSRAETTSAVFLVHHNPDTGISYYACEHASLCVESRLDRARTLDAERQIVVKNGVLGQVEELDRATYSQFRHSLERLGQAIRNSGNETFRIRTRNYDTRLALNQLSASGWLNLSLLEQPASPPVEAPPIPTEQPHPQAPGESPAPPAPVRPPTPTPHPTAPPGSPAIEPVAVLEPVRFEQPTEISPVRPVRPISYPPVRPRGTETDGTDDPPAPPTPPVAPVPPPIRPVAIGYSGADDGAIKPIRGSNVEDSPPSPTPTPQPIPPLRPRILDELLPVAQPINPSNLIHPLPATPFNSIVIDEPPPAPAPLPLPQPVRPAKLVLHDLSIGSESNLASGALPKAGSPIGSRISEVDTPIHAPAPSKPLPTGVSPPVTLPPVRVELPAAPVVGDTVVLTPPLKVPAHIAAPLPSADTQLRPATDLVLPRIDVAVGDGSTIPVPAPTNPLPPIPLPPATIAPQPLDLSITAPIAAPLSGHDGAILPAPAGPALPQVWLPSETNPIQFPLNHAVGPLSTELAPSDSSIAGPMPAPLATPGELNPPTTIERLPVSSPTHGVTTSTGTTSGSSGG